MNKPDFAAARGLFAILTGLSYLGIVVGIFVLLYGMAETGSANRSVSAGGVTMAFAGFVVLIVSFLSLAGTQVARAVVDNAMISWEILEELRNDRKSFARSSDASSTQMRRQSESTISTAAPLPISTPRESVTVVARGLTRQGTVSEDGRYIFETLSGPKEFETLDEAKRYFT